MREGVNGTEGEAGMDARTTGVHPAIRTTTGITNHLTYIGSSPFFHWTLDRAWKFHPHCMGVLHHDKMLL